MLFADDAAIAAPSEQQLQSLLDRFSAAFDDFSLAISLKKTQVMAQAAPTAPSVTIKNFQLEVVHHFTYLGPTAADNLSLDVELDKRIGKAATTGEY